MNLAVFGTSMRSIRQEARRGSGDCPSASGGGATTSQYYQYDHRGNVVAVTDSTGDIQYGYQYDAFGNITFSFDEGGTTAPTDDILFTGKDFDPDTSLYYFNARWYESEIGTFLSRGPLRPSEEHPYGFCGGNPVLHVDPSGEGVIAPIYFSVACGLATAVVALYIKCMVDCIISYCRIYNNQNLRLELRIKYGSSWQSWFGLCQCECAWILFGAGYAAASSCLGFLAVNYMRHLVKKRGCG